MFGGVHMGFRKDLAKAGIVLAAAGVIFTAGATPVSAKVVSDVGVAGITRQLDKFYTNKKTVKKTSVKASKKETVTATKQCDKSLAVESVSSAESGCMPSC